MLGWEAWLKPWGPQACRAPGMLALFLPLDPDVRPKPAKQGSKPADGCAGGCFHACLHGPVISNKKHEFLLHISMSGSAFFHVASWGTSHKTKTRVVGHGCCQIKSQRCFALLCNLSQMLDHSRNPKSKLSCSPSALKYEIFFPFTFATVPDVTLGITTIYMNLTSF